jgi:hypothetical protein
LENGCTYNKRKKKRELDPMLKLLSQLEKIDGDTKDKDTRQFLEVISNMKKLGTQAGTMLDIMEKTEENMKSVFCAGTKSPRVCVPFINPLPQKPPLPIAILEGTTLPPLIIARIARNAPEEPYSPNCCPPKYSDIVT